MGNRSPGDPDWDNLFKSVFEQLGAAVVITDADFTGGGPRLQFVNNNFEELFGYDCSEVIGHPLTFFWSASDRGEILKDIKLRLAGDENSTRQAVVYDAERSARRVSCSYYGIRDNSGNLTNIVFLFRRARVKGSREQLQYMAYYDPLTGLPNRSLFNDRLSQALSRASRNKKSVAVLFIDLDGFKKVNDSLGHQLGDHFLKIMSQRLLGRVRESDTIARVGGDEFAILLNDIGNRADVLALAQDLRVEFEKVIRIGEEEHWSVGASIGAAIYPDDGQTEDILMERADQAMYRCKKFGGRDVELYSEASRRLDSKAGRLREKFIVALEKNEFEIYYQPEVDVLTGQITSVEALIRWHQPDEGLLFPDWFMQRAEMVGMLTKLEEWVLAKVCHQAGQWHRKYDFPLKVSVNLAGQSLLHRELIELVPRIITNSKTNPDFIQIEISERDALRDIDFIVSAFEQLNQIGVRTCLDSFGSTFTALQHLSLFPVSKFKFSRKLTAQLPFDENAFIIASQVIKKALSRQQEIIPVGIENRDQLNFFRRQGCSVMQGNLFSPALRLRELEQLLESGKLLTPPLSRAAATA